MYHCNGFMKHAEVDNYENGCDPNTTKVSSNCIYLEEETLEDLIEHITREFDCEKNALSFNSCEEQGRIDIQIYEKDNGNKPSDAEMELWKKGVLQLWLCTYTIHVYTSTLIDFDEDGTELI